MRSPGAVAGVLVAMTGTRSVPTGQTRPSAPNGRWSSAGASAAVAGMARFDHARPTVLLTQLPVGSIGQTVNSTGHCVWNDGHSVMTTGQRVVSGGQRVWSDGQCVSSTGHCVGPGGH